MRIRNIKITNWRNFENLDISFSAESPVICIVGANGVGKSQILELISSCAQYMGLASGSESNRNSPFAEEGSFSVTFFIPNGLITEIDDPNRYPEPYLTHYKNWDRTITIHHEAVGHYRLDYGSSLPEKHPQFPSHITQIISSSTAVHYLSLDADRSYPKITIQAHELSQVYDTDWESAKKQSSFRLSKNLYEEWIRYFVGQENQINNLYAQSVRLARNTGQPDPKFFDRFDSYKNAVRRVLPHLLFVGVDAKTRVVKFDSTGTPLSFEQLSGGEREIAFIIGQIDRFSLKKGLLLIDEPELHLNPDLLRVWIGFLKDSVEAGQIWLATHSLDVVEVVGQSSTVILERSGQKNQVTASSLLSGRPVISALSKAIGSPAFSISKLAFVYIEGEEEVGERERFRKLCENPTHVRFIEAGSCKEVIKKLGSIKDLANASGQVLRAGGVVDKDWRSESECESLRKQGLFVLDVHEVENLFLHPETAKDWIYSTGEDPDYYDHLLLDAADSRAGSWIFDSTRSDKTFKEFAAPAESTREYVHRLTWSDFADPKSQCSKIVSTETDLTSDQKKLLARHLEVRAKVYARIRTETTFWRRVEGKEVFKSIFNRLGFADQDFAERAISTIWARKTHIVPVELTELRKYVCRL